MADNRKEQEREELHKAIWSIANDLRGSVDGWDFKQYVLGIMFYRYISENITNYINAGEHETGNNDFDYAKLSDSEAEQAREDMVMTKGFFILPSQLFCNVRKNAKNNENLNETLEKAFKAIENSAVGNDSEGDMFWLAIDENDRVIGSVGYSSVESSDEVWLHRLFVKYNLKRKGIGGALLQMAESNIKSKGKTAIRIHLGEQ